MVKLSPSQIKIIKEIVGDNSVKARAIIGETEDRIKIFLKYSIDFAQKNFKALSNKEYCLFLGKSRNKLNKLTLRVANRNINSNKRIFYVDEQLGLIKTVEEHQLFKACSEITERENTIGVYVQYDYIIVYIKGMPKDQFTVEGDKNKPFVLAKHQRPMNEFEEILNDHKRECLDKEIPFSHWKSRKDRILSSEQGGTEMIFHRSLIQWLRDHVINSIDIYAETVGLGQDRVDIGVVTIDGSEVIEIKWLGRNQKISYGESQINVGLEQMKIYLDKNDKYIMGYLVVYDARSRDEHENNSNYNQNCLHSSCNPPNILFLESEKPSETAKKLASSR